MIQIIHYNLSMKVYTFQDHLKESLKDPKFSKEWKASEVYSEISRIIATKRLEKKMSMKELAKRANTTQAVISRLENMNANPSIGLLQKIASALNLHLKIQLQ